MDHTPEERSLAVDWTPPQRPSCSCAEHHDDLTDLILPVTEPGAEALPVRELVAARRIGAEPVALGDRWWELYDETDTGPDRIGPFHWALRVGDEARRCYHDDAELTLDQALLAQPGVQLVEWMDREAFLVGAHPLRQRGGGHRRPRPGRPTGTPIACAIH